MRIHDYGAAQFYSYLPSKGSESDQVGYTVPWQTTFPNVGYSAIKWLTVDMYGDGRSEIVQLWNNRSSLAITVFPQGKEYGSYYVGNTSRYSNIPVSDAEWLAVDIDGDGKDEIVKLWNIGTDVQQELAMTILSPNYKDDGPSYNNGVTYKYEDTGVGALKWLVVDMMGNGKHQLAQIWNSNGKLAITIFLPIEVNGNPCYSRGHTTVYEYTGVGSIDWLVVDMNGDNKEHIVQVWKEGYQTMTTVFFPTVDMNGNLVYARSYLSKPTYFQSEPVAWLVVDIKDDGRNQIVAVWRSSFGDLRMNVFWPSTNGQPVYLPNQSSGPLGTRTDAFAWLVVDKAQIIQINNSTPQTLQMSLYSPNDQGTYVVSGRNLSMGLIGGRDTWLVTPLILD
ncbi:MAG: hypothetical protein EOO88_48950 [Pedobacter sp.]|nr:MAG: hypothetical protein EOO88_48950 [Pedobacter sp.]